MNIAVAAAIALRVLLHEYCYCCSINIAIAAAIALRHECYRYCKNAVYCCCMNVIVAAAITLRATLHEDDIYHMPVTTVITASVKAYPNINWLVCSTAQV